MKKRLKSVRDVVDAFGGTSQTADFLGVVDSAVSNYLKAGEIARGHHLLLYLELTRRGYDVDLELFQITPNRLWKGNGLAAPSAA